MPRLVITHNVTDVDAWLSFNAERTETVTGIGGTNVADHVAVDGSRSVAVSADVEDVDSFLATLAATAEPSTEDGHRSADTVG